MQYDLLYIHYTLDECVFVCVFTLAIIDREAHNKMILFY